MAPRRRGVRRRRRACRPATRGRVPDLELRRFGHGRSRTSGSSRPTTSAACSSATARTSQRTFGGRAPEYYRGGEATGAGDRGTTTTTTTTSRRPAQLLQAGLRGHPPLAGAQAVDVVEAPRDERVRRGSIEAQRRPRRLPRPPLRRVRRLRGAPGRARAVGRLLPAPAGRPRGGAGAGAGELDAHQDGSRRALEASGDGWLSTTRLRGATWLRAGIVNYLTTEADIDRLLATLRRLATDLP